MYRTLCFRLTQFLCMRIFFSFLWEYLYFVKSETWVISRCLGLSHETMVCVVCLTIKLHGFLINSSRTQWRVAPVFNRFIHWLKPSSFQETWKCICIVSHFSTLRWHRQLSPSLWKICIRLSCIFNIMVVDALSTQCVRTSRAMLFTWLSRNILVMSIKTKCVTYLTLWHKSTSCWSIRMEKQVYL